MEPAPLVQRDERSMGYLTIAQAHETAGGTEYEWRWPTQQVHNVGTVQRAPLGGLRRRHLVVT